MSLEQRKGIIDFFKIIMLISLSISGFLLASNYTEIKENQDRMKDQLDAHQREVIKTTNEIQNRVIRIEYELKLK